MYWYISPRKLTSRIIDAIERLIVDWLPCAEIAREKLEGARTDPTAEKALREALKKAREIVVIFVFTHTKWMWHDREQDPTGSHALLAEIDALLVPEVQT